MYICHVDGGDKEVLPIGRCKLTLEPPDGKYDEQDELHFQKLGYACFVFGCNVM